MEAGDAAWFAFVAAAKDFAAHLDEAADAVGVDRETVMRRIDVLLEAAGGKI